MLEDICHPFVLLFEASVLAFPIKKKKNKIQVLCRIQLLLPSLAETALHSRSDGCLRSLFQVTTTKRILVSPCIKTGQIIKVIQQVYHVSTTVLGIEECSREIHILELSSGISIRTESPE